MSQLSSFSLPEYLQRTAEGLARDFKRQYGSAPMDDTLRKRIEKEIQGLEAKLRWDHVSDGVKKGYEARISELRRRLREGGE